MRKQLSILMLLAALIVPWASRAQGTAISSFPWSCNFEDATVNEAWTITNASPNGWYIGAATNNGGDSALYVSDANGTTSNYSGSACVSYAYVTFEVTDPGQYAIQFDWKCNGESTYDFLRVAVAMATTSLPTSYSDWTSTSVPSGFTAIDGGSKLNLQTSWQTNTSVVSVTTAGTYRLIFVWRNDGSVYNQPPAAIDNVTITELTCPQPTALSAIPSADQIDFSWTPGGSESEWKVTVNETFVDITTDTFYSAINLTPNTPYTIKVYGICGADDTSLATVANVRTSCVALDSLPYSYGFEDAATGTSATFPACWNRINDASGTYNYYPYVSNTASYVHTGSNGLYWYHTTTTTYADNEFAILPPVDLDVYDMTDLTLAFWVKTTSASYHPQPIIGVMTNPGDATTFTPVRTLSATDVTTTWQMFDVSFANYTGAGNYIAIKWPRPSSASYMAIDDIYLTDSWCNMPSDVTAVSTTDEVTLSWNPNGGSSFEVVFNGDTIANVTDTFYTVTNLTANTLYTYSVANECTEGNSQYVSGSIYTLCVALDSLPYVQDFEAAATGGSQNASFVNCMYRLNNGSSYFGYPYVGGSTYNHTTGGAKGLYWYNSTTTGTYGDYQIVVLPPVDTTVYPINTLRLTFWARPSSTSYSPQFQVGVMTNPTDPTTFQQVGVVNVASSTTWQEFTTMLGSYTGTGVFVAIRAIRSTSWYAYVDDITLEPMPSCPSVVSHNVTSTAAAAHITWAVEQGFPFDPDSYVVNYGYAADSLSNATTVTVNDPELVLTGLDDDTAYMVSISAVCNNEPTAAHVFTFTTQRLACLEWDTTATGGGASPAATYVVGTPGTSTTNVMPVNGAYNYSYCNHLILRSDISTVPTGTTYFSGIDFQYAGTAPMVSKTNCTIYMCHTAMTVCDAFANPADLVLVYEGPLNCDANGWNHFEFNRGTFAYNGTSNIIVAIVDNSGAHNTAETFYYENIGTSRSHRVYRDNAPYTFAELGTVTAGNSVWRSNMRLTTGGNGGGACLTQASCAAPAVWVEKDTAGNLEVSWIPGYQETDWDLDYKAADDTIWTNVLTGTSNTEHTILMSSLLANTEYTFRVTANCSDTNIAGTATYTTPCSYISIPYSYGFEDMATTGSSVHPDIPCWHHLNNATSYYGYPYVSSTAHNSTRSLYWYLSTTTGTYGDYEIVVLPPVDTTINPINTLQLSFWAKPTSTSYAPVFYVGVMSDPLDVNTFQYVDTVNVAHTTTDWDIYECNLDNYTGNGEYVAIRANRPSSAWYAYLDDVNLGQIPVCARVENVGATNITDSSVTIYWDTTSSTEYDVQYGPAGFAVGAGTMVHVIDFDSVNIAGLTANTAYDVYVRGNCPQDSGTWSFVYTFRTACVAYAIPYTEDFESYGSGSAQGISPCWAKGTSSSTAYPYPYSTNAVSGSRSLYFYGYKPSSTTTTAIYSYAALPAFQEPLNSLQLDFKVRTYSTASDYYYTYLVVGVMSNPADISTFTAVDTINLAGAAASSIHDVSVSFGNYAGNGQYIAIYDPVPPLLNSTNYAYSYAYVDDIMVDYLPACPRVEHLTAFPMLTTATISWEDTSSTNTSWYVEYDTVAFAPGTGHMTPILVTDTFAVLNNLDSGTFYHVYVYPDCDTNVLYRHATFTTLAASPAGVPYFCDFEAAGVNGWDLIGGQNYWMVGNATHNGGARSMYVTNDGSANAYSNGVISYSYATRAFNLTDTGEYAYGYDWKGVGESHYYDFTRVFLTPASETFDAATVLGGSTYNFATAACPAGWFELTQSGASPNTLSQQSTWQSVTGTINITTPGTYKMVFVWANDGSGGTNPPTAIDNVSLQHNTCPAVTNLISTAATSSSITIDWTNMATGTGEWQVRCSGPTGISVTTVTSHPTTISGLTAMSGYTFSVRPICGVGDTGMWCAGLTVATSMCDNPSVAQNWDTNMSTGTSSYSPIGYSFYNYSYTQIIIDSAQMAEIGGDITAFAFYPANTTAGSYFNNMDVYMANVSENNLSSSFIHPDANHTFVQVITAGNFNYTTTDEQVVAFDNPFTWDGHSNVLFAVNRQHGSYSSGASFHAHTHAASQMRYVYNDGSAYDINSVTGGTAQTSVGDIKLISCGASCPAPTALTASNVTYNAATVNWSGSDSTEIGIHEGLWDETGVNFVTVTNHTYTFTGLAQNTQYTVAARTLCEDNMTSNWTFVTFTTEDLPCFAPSNIQVSNQTTNGGKVTWTPGGNETEWVVNVFRTGIIDTNITVINTPMCNVSGLYAATTYTISVASVCGGIDTVWCDSTATLTTTACLPPTEVEAVANGHTAIVTWEGSGANEYHVLWYLEGFTTGADSVVVTNGTTNATITGLAQSETYDIYVFAYCDGQRSAQAGQTQVTITGIDDVNSSLINLYPNPANTTVTVDGIQGEAQVTIVDMNGRTVFSEKAVGKLTIDLNGMAQGAYFVRITGENTTAIRKLIVK